MKNVFEHLCYLLLGACLTGTLSSCGDHQGKPNAVTRPKPTAYFAVASDPHIYDNQLGIEGDEFETDSRFGRTLIQYSEDIFNQFTNELLDQNPPPQFLIVPGDLTRNGARQSHLLAAELMQVVNDSGIEVFVIPGNHDIANPEASGYSEHGKIPAQVISPQDFEDIYFNFGYAQAISRDPHSLSYAVEPVSGYRLLAIDSCRYDENNDYYHVVGGRIKTETLAWIKDNLSEAKRLNKQVLAFIHHPVLEPVAKMGEILPELVLGNNEETAQELAGSGLNIIFTGHLHANKITQKYFLPEEPFIDIQTGSLCAWPHPYRYIRVDPKEETFVIETEHIKELPSEGMSEDQFSSYSKEFSMTNTSEIFQSVAEATLSLDNRQMDEYIPMLTQGAHALFHGDQKPELSTFATIFRLMASNDPDEAFIGPLLLTMWQEIPPQDNDLTLSMP